MTGFNSSRAVELGAELRGLRLDAGLTQLDVAQRLGRSHSHPSRWERGKLLPSETDTASMLTLYGVPEGEERDRLLAMAREAADPNWVVPGVGRRVAALVAMEKAARRIVNVELQFIPGLLQTAAYARMVAAIAGIARDQIDPWVEFRLGRQAVLDNGDPPEFVAVISEFALRYPPCDAATMAEQLRKLATVGELPNVSIHILPMTVTDTPASFGSFVLIEPRPRRGDPVVRQEHYRATTTLSSRRDVRDCQTAVDMILRRAMSTVGSALLIAEILEQTGA